MKEKLLSQLTDVANITPFLGGGGSFLVSADAQASMLVFLCLFVLLHIPRLEQRVSTMEGTLVKIDGRLTSVEGRLTSVEGRLTGVEGRLTNVEGGMAKLEGNLKDANESIRNSSVRIDRLYELNNK